ncbi:MAG: putative metalloprotease CJM1_0395 family protein [Pseudomonadota bacterium]
MISGVTPIPVTPTQTAARPADGNRTSVSSTNADAQSVDPIQQDAIQALQTLQAGQTTSDNPEGLTEEEQKIVQELQQTDQKVRAHEQAHKNVAGPYAGAISYETVTGPDGQQYAVGGSVQIDTSPIPDNPRATIQKLEVVVRAALAPADPSPEDFAVARAAQQGIQQARNELRQQEEAERQDSRESSPIEQAILDAIESYKKAETTA